jgi:hypothetical protein
LVQQKGPISRAFLCNIWSGREDLNLRPLGPEPTERIVFPQRFRQLLVSGNHRVIISGVTD